MSPLSSAQPENWQDADHLSKHTHTQRYVSDNSVLQRWKGLSPSPTTPLISDLSHKLLHKTKMFPNSKCMVQGEMQHMERYVKYVSNTLSRTRGVAETHEVPRSVRLCCPDWTFRHWQNKKESRRENRKSDYQQVFAKAITTTCLQRQRAF